jgi:polysaccharide pyruvyl transferase WcaK-like protein
MEYIRRMFVEANRQNKARIIFGCGIGPLHTDRMHQITDQILQLSTAGFFRDEESYEYARQAAPDNLWGFACDPALAFLQDWLGGQKKSGSDLDGPTRIVGLLRANTKEFIADQTQSELRASNMQVAEHIARFLENTCTTQKAKVELLPMNSPWIGGDDRLFNRQVANYFENPDVVHVRREYLPLNDLIQSLQTANAAVAMRYHGHLFCIALGIPFLSVNYSGKTGKVGRLVQRIGYGHWAEDWGNIDVGRASNRLQKLLEERDAWSIHLQDQARKMVADLYNTYDRVFCLSSGDSK